MTTEPTYTYVDDLRALIPEITPDRIVNKLVSTEGGTKTILFAFAAGQELSEHSAPHTVILHFLSGEAEVSLNGETFTAKPHSWLQMPPRLLHSVHANTDTYMLLTMLPV